MGIFGDLYGRYLDWQHRRAMEDLHKSVDDLKRMLNRHRGIDFEMTSGQPRIYPLQGVETVEVDLVEEDNDATPS